MRPTVRPLMAALVAAGLACSGTAFAQSAAPATDAQRSTGSAAGASASTQDARMTNGSVNARRTARDADKAWEQTHRASKIIGTDVRNAEGEKIGNVKDVVIDPASGRVTHMVLSVGGVLGIADKLFAIPFRSVGMAEGQDHIVLKERSALAAGFDDRSWPRPGDAVWLRGEASTADSATPPALPSASSRSAGTPADGSTKGTATGTFPDASTAGGTSAGGGTSGMSSRTSPDTPAAVPDTSTTGTGAASSTGADGTSGSSVPSAGEGATAAPPSATGTQPSDAAGGTTTSQ